MGLPLIGETLSFFATFNSIDIHPFVNERIKRYGPLFKTSIAGRPMVVSTDPDFSYFVLQQEEKLVELYYMDSFAEVIHKDNMSNIGGYLHKYVRRAVLSHFGHEALKQKLSQFEDAINHELHEWTKQPEVDVKNQTPPMLFDFATKILIGCKLEENLGQDLSNILQVLMTFPLYIPGTAFYKCIKKQRKALKVTSKLVEERMKKYYNDPKGWNKKGDFLDQIVGDMGKEAFLTKERVSYLLFALLFATVETISAIITLAVKYLLDNPSAVQQLTEEHEEILKKRENGNSGLLWNEYKSMTFTHYVINETLRLANITPGILRRVITDIHVDGYIIPKGWILLIMPTPLHLNPHTYEDPLSFNPSRWKNIGGNTMAKNFLPFGGGNRACAGAEFSKVLMAVDKNQGRGRGSCTAFGIYKWFLR
ncbi:hypothetical protein REPUB_Repub11eG0154900 [Reevesia pubescens]